MADPAIPQPKPVNPPGTPSIVDRMKDFMFGSGALKTAAGPTAVPNPIPAQTDSAADMAKRNQDYVDQMKAAKAQSQPTPKGGK